MQPARDQLQSKPHDSAILAFPAPLKIIGSVTESASEILTPAALRFLSELSRVFEPIRQELLHQRKTRYEEMRGGGEFGFLDATRELRQASWKIAPLPEELSDRRVEITAPVDRKMMINALNSGAQAFMADFEDSHCPRWDLTLQGQINLRDAVQRTLSYDTPQGKRYALNEKVAVLMVRPRGWHLVEKHIEVAGAPIAASLFDFGLFFFHNAKNQLVRGTRPYFYLPKLESHLEARLWNDVFNFSQDYLEIPRGTIKATVLIETFPAVFETDEILYELRQHSAGLNCGRWDYIFSFIKKHSERPEFVLPDRSLLQMTQPFLKIYSDHVLASCRRRGAPALGGMAAQIPIKENSDANLRATQLVAEDKQREALAGFDGTWVAHPGLVKVARDAFSNRKSKPPVSDSPSETEITRRLLEVPKGEITEQGIRTSLRVSLIYLESWLRGNGCVPIDHLMEDAATAEISRSLLWQWMKFDRLAQDRCQQLMDQEIERIRSEKGSTLKLEEATRLLWSLISAPVLDEFLTSIAYREID